MPSPRVLVAVLGMAASVGCSRDAPPEPDATPASGVLTYVTGDGLVVRAVPGGAPRLWIDAGAGPFQIAFTDAAGQPVQTLAGTSASLALPDLLRGLRWSRDGQRLAIEWEWGFNLPEVGVVTLADLADGDRRITVQYLGHGHLPSWNDAGDRLLHDACEVREGTGYVDCEGAGAAVTRIWMYELASGARVDLTGDNLSEYHPDWIPGTSDYLFATGRRTDGSGEDPLLSLARRRTDAGPDTLAIVYRSSRGNVLYPRAAPGGDAASFVKIATSSDDFLVHRVALAGGPARTLTASGNAADPRWSPDGSAIAFDALGGIEVIDTTGARVDRVEGAAAFDWCPGACGP